MSQKHSGLAVGYLSQRPAVLAGYTHRFQALLGEIAAVEHPHRLRVLRLGARHSCNRPMTA